MNRINRCEHSHGFIPWAVNMQLIKKRVFNRWHHERGTLNIKPLIEIELFFLPLIDIIVSNSQPREKWKITKFIHTNTCRVGFNMKTLCYGLIVMLIFRLACQLFSLSLTIFRSLFGRSVHWMNLARKVTPKWMYIFVSKILNIS